MRMPGKSWKAKKIPEVSIQDFGDFLLEAPSRFELEVKVLQTSALPLGYGARIVVPSLGIEPRTRRSSIYCSTN